MQEIFQFNPNITGNLTSFQKVQEVAVQPYFTTVLLIIFGAVLFIYLLFCFTRVAGRKSAYCFQSFVYWRGFLFILFIMLLLFLAFYYPLIFTIMGG